MVLMVSHIMVLKQWELTSNERTQVTGKRNIICHIKYVMTEDATA